ncbi:MAG: hypothetical protein KBD43_14655 [Saprospiraceae bacterium]|nr:hypothetical protein [Saprospiraceae bacterium]
MNKASLLALLLLSCISNCFPTITRAPVCYNSGQNPIAIIRDNPTRGRYSLIATPI